MQLTLGEGESVTNATVGVMDITVLIEKVAEFAESVRLPHEDMAKLTDKQKRQRRAQQRRMKAALPFLNIVPFVLVLLPTRQRSKLLYQYAGLYLITETVSIHIYKCKLMGAADKPAGETHISRVLRYADKNSGNS